MARTERGLKGIRRVPSVSPRAPRSLIRLIERAPVLPQVLAPLVSAPALSSAQPIDGTITITKLRPVLLESDPKRLRALEIELDVESKQPWQLGDYGHKDFGSLWVEAWIESRGDDKDHDRHPDLFKAWGGYHSLTSRGNSRRLRLGSKPGFDPHAAHPKGQGRPQTAKSVAPSLGFLLTEGTLSSKEHGTIRVASIAGECGSSRAPDQR